MNGKVLAIVAVAILAVAGIGTAVVLLNNNNNSDDSGITITDDSGKVITISSPLTNVAVLNSNVPRAMLMLGLGDKISCYHYSGTFDIKAEEDASNKLGTYYTPSVETLLQKGVQAVLCPVYAMTLYTSSQKACEEVGIKVIRLECNGASLNSDLAKISKLFGNPESAVKTLNEYNSNSEKITAAITDKLKAENITLENYLFAFAARGAVYNQSSTLNKNFEPIFKQNVTALTNLSTDGVSNPVVGEGSEGNIEALHAIETQIDNFFIRANSKEVTEAEFLAHFSTFVGADKALTGSCKAVDNGDVYVVNNALASGLYMPIGLLMIAEKVYGIEITVTLDFGTEKTYTGLADLSSLISDFQSRYYQKDLASGNLLLSQISSAGTTTSTLAMA